MLELVPIIHDFLVISVNFTEFLLLAIPKKFPPIRESRENLMTKGEFR